MYGMVCFFADKRDLALLATFIQEQGLECLYQKRESLPLGEIGFAAQKIDISKDFPDWWYSILITKYDWIITQNLNKKIKPAQANIIELTLRQIKGFDVFDCRLYAVMDYFHEDKIVAKLNSFQKTCTALMDFVHNNTVPFKKTRLMPQAYQIFMQNPQKLQIGRSFFETT